VIGRKTLLVNPPLVNGVAFTRQGRCQEREEVLGTTKPPYTLALSAVDYTAVSETSDDGYPIRDHIARIVDGLNLTRCDPSPKQRGQIVNAVAAALARGVAAPVVADHARRKASEAKTCAYLVKAFSAEHLTVDAPTTNAPAVGNPCGECDARPSDPISARVVWLDADRTRSQRCPRCHPHATGGAR